MTRKECLAAREGTSAMKIVTLLLEEGLDAKTLLTKVRDELRAYSAPQSRRENFLHNKAKKLAKQRESAQNSAQGGQIA